MNAATWTARLRRVASLLSICFVAGMCVLFALRAGHPYLLEWQEGAMVDQVARILSGRVLYAEPSLDFVAQIYAPLYFYASAAVAGVTGIGFGPLRAVSIAATLGLLACMARFVWGETRDGFAALLSVGLFCATYPLAAAFLDVGRVDALFLFFCMAGVWVVRSAESARAMLAAALLFTLAFATKQQGLAFCLAMAVWVAFARGPARAAWLVGGFALLAGTYTLGLAAATDGWSSFYLYALPGSHEIFWPMAWGFWWGDMLRPLAPACALALAWLIARARARAFDDVVFWLMLLGAGTAVSMASRMHWGGATNVVLPAYMVIALCFGVAAARLLPEAAGLLPHTARDGRLGVGLAALCVAQLAWLGYDPRPLMPSEADRRAGDAFVAALAGIDGEVLASWHGHLPTLAGKAVFAHRSAVYDVMRSDRELERAKLQAEYDDALAAHRFGAVVVDQPYFLRPYEREALERNYRHVGPMLEPGLEIGGLLGYRSNPHLYVPRVASPGGGTEGATESGAAPGAALGAESGAEASGSDGSPGEGRNR